jgi:uncharacterized delta-60 repeat protein
MQSHLLSCVSVCAIGGIAACGGGPPVKAVGGDRSGTADISAALSSLGEKAVSGVGVMTQPGTQMTLIHFTDAAFATGKYGFARFDSGGGLDPSFGTGGMLEYQVEFSVQNGLSDGIAPRVALGPRGEIWIAVKKGTRGASDVVVSRWSRDGRSDPDLGASAGVAVDLGTIDEPLAIHALDDGGAIVSLRTTSGDQTHPQPWAFGLARVRADGTLDPAFGDGGKAIYADDPRDLQSQTDFTYAMPDGSLLAGGGARIDGSFDPRTALVHYLADGRRDRSFGGSGISYLAATSWASAVVTPLGHGFVVVSGARGCTTELQISEFDADGTPRRSFGNAGSTTVPYGRCSLDQFGGEHAVELGDGKLVLSSAVSSGFAFLGLTQEGKLDPAFGIGGFRVAGPPHHATENQFVRGLAVTPDGKVLSLENAQSFDAHPCPSAVGEWCGPAPMLMLTRLLSTGADDTSFPR